MVRLRGLGLCCAAFASLRPHLHVAAGAARRQGRPQMSSASYLIGLGADSWQAFLRLLENVKGLV